MAWLIVLLAAGFGWVSLSMYLSAFKEKNPDERNKLMRSGFGTLILAMMGLMFAWYSFNPATPAG